MGELVKLTISRCETENGVIKSVSTDKKFTVMLNPSQYSHTREIKYDSQKAQGSVASQMKFANLGAEKVNFDIILDGTGAIPSRQPKEVSAQITELNAIVYTYNGTNHEPNHVQLLWGTFIFFGRLTSMSTDYTMFKPSGDPLRAKLKLAFAGFMSVDEQNRKANRTSPDLSHVVEIRLGDTLPLLCHRIYKDASYYKEVARANDLVSFRELKPGTRIHFPPLE